MALTKIVKNGITADAVDATKIADDAISEEHLDVTAITGNAELSAQAEDNDVLLVFDTSAGAIKKIQKSNVSLAVPSFSSVSPTSLLTGDGTGNHTIVVTGTKFDATATFKIRTNGGTDIDMDSVTRNSATQLTGVVAKSTSGITNANEPFDIVITNESGLTSVATNQLNIDAQPVYVTAAGTLGTFTGGSAIATTDIVATDPESAGNVSFEFQSGSLPAGLSSATVHENGVSKFRITGTPTNPVANTTTNFVLRAVDAASNVTSRAFAMTVNRTFTATSFTSSGTFAVPSGVTSLDAVLVVAGGGGGGDRHAGGGGAGGLVFMPSYPVTPGGTIVVTVGCGGTGGQPSPGQGGTGQDSIFAASPSPGKHPTGDVLTAKGGGGGNTSGAGVSGGSGGGGGHSGPSSTGGSATQPTQSGDSGAYGFGHAGGQKTGNPGVQGGAGAGGGGAGAVGGQTNSPTNVGGQGGIGKAYTIADGTSPVYYAGGGGGSDHGPSGAQAGGGGEGGQGGGADGLSVSNAAPFNGPNTGVANRGGGGGGGTRSCTAYNGGTGGKGIVIVRY